MNSPAPDDPAFSVRGYTLRRWHVDEFFARRAPKLQGPVLDLGGTRENKRGRFDIERLGIKTYYANISAAKRPHVLADAAAVPFADAAFTSVICAELLEHVYDPREVLHEARRVLKSGGTLLATAPFLYRIHGDPEDYARYTDRYWARLLSELGFRNVEIEFQGNLWSVLADFLRQADYEAGSQGWPRGMARRALYSRGAAWAERKLLGLAAKSAGGSNAFIRSFTTGFGIAAVKA